MTRYVFQAEHAILVACIDEISKVIKMKANKIFFSAGIGITPFSSILQSLWKKHNDLTTLKKHKKIDFIWVNREYESFEWFMNLIAELIMQQSLKNEKFIDIHLYCTDKNCENSIVMKNFSNIISSMPETNLRSKIEEMFKGIQKKRPDFSHVFLNHFLNKFCNFLFLVTQNY